MKPKKIKAIIFDVGGVLQLDKYSLSKMRLNHTGIHEYMAKKFKISVDNWFDSIDSIYAKSIENKATRNQVIKTMSKNLNINEKKLTSSFHRAYKKFFRKNKPLYRIAYKLKKQGYKIGILSDQWHLSKESLMQKKDIKGFNPIIISCEAGLRKPNPEMYKLLIKKIKLKPKEILFVDNRKWNIPPAKELGMQTLLFKNNKQTIKELKKLIPDKN